MESCVAEFARPPRVMHLISSSGFLGAENVVLELALQSRKTGLDVQIGVMVNAENPNLELAEIAAKNGFNVTVHQCSGRLDKRVIGVIKGLIHDNGIDIVHSHNYKSNFYAWRALCGTPCKWVITNHGRRSGFRLLLYNLADAFVARHADRVIAVSDRIFRMLRCAGVPDCKVRIIDNGIDTDRFAGRQPPEGLEVSLGIPADALVIGSVGALTLEKGHVYLLRASSAVLERFPLAVFLIIGDGPERAALKKEACKLGISEHVVFAGKRKDIPELLNIMDIFVLPSLQEGLPIDRKSVV